MISATLKGSTEKEVPPEPLKIFFCIRFDSCKVRRLALALLRDHSITQESPSIHWKRISVPAIRCLLFCLFFSAGVPLTKQTEETRVWNQKVVALGQRTFAYIEHDWQSKHLRRSSHCTDSTTRLHLIWRERCSWKKTGTRTESYVTVRKMYSAWWVQKKKEL